MTTYADSLRYRSFSVSLSSQNIPVNNLWCYCEEMLIFMSTSAKVAAATTAAAFQKNDSKYLFGHEMCCAYST